MDRGACYRQVAELHAASIEGGFLSTLGPRFLALVYRAIDEAPGSVLIVEAREGRVVGFVSGGTGMGPIYRRLLRAPLALARALAPSMLRPARLWRILEIMRYGKVVSDGKTMPAAELLSIAVAPDARGQGVAESLYRSLLEHFRSRGVGDFRIVVGDGLGPAHRFYRRMGATLVGRIEVHSGEGSSVYVQAVRDSSTG